MAVPALLGCLYAEIVADLAESGVIKEERRNQKPSEIASHMRSQLGAESLEEIRRCVRSRIGPDFRTVIVGGAAADPAMIDILDAVGIRMEVGYGLTEASPIVSVGLGRACPPGSVGRAIPGVEVRIGANEEILVCGPNVMKGYWRDAEATASAFENGWLRTGDRGHLDEDGFLFVTGRLKEVLVTDTGETIHPEEFEQCYQSPIFAELCVAGVSGGNGNDLPVLFVVPASPAISESEIEATFAKLRAAAPSRLRIKSVVRIQNPLPRTATGKVRRVVLAQQINPEETYS
jgi:long-chain acyl-CoA synthetase